MTAVKDIQQTMHRVIPLGNQQASFMNLLSIHAITLYKVVLFCVFSVT